MKYSILILVSLLLFNSSWSCSQTLDINNTGNLYIFPGAEISLFGNVINSGNFQSSGGDVFFVGSSQQNVSGTNPVNIYHAVLDNSGGLKIDNQLNIDQLFSFVNGKVLSDRADYATEFLHFLEGSTYEGFSNIAFVDGAVRKTGNTAFYFPVGSGTDAQTISMDAPSNSLDSYIAYYNYVDPMASNYDPTSFDSGINNVSRCEYWVFDPVGDPSIVTLSLNFDVNSCGVTAMEDLRVVRWDGTKWEDLGSASTTGTPSDGIITSFKSCNTCTTSSPITIASISSLNPLPVELVDFNATLYNRKVDLNWQTASEHNNDFFTVERSADGINFESVLSVKGAGNSNEYLSYASVDELPLQGLSYYRLKQTDFDGAFKYSAIRVVNLDNISNVLIYPNPSTGNVNIASKTTLENPQLITADGRKVWSSEHETQFSLSLSSGVYYLHFNQENDNYTQKIIILE